MATGLLRELEGPDLTGLSVILENLRLNPFDILSQDASDFLMGVARRLWSDGEFLREPEGTLPENKPTIRRAPVLMLTPRGRGYSEAAEHLLQQMDKFEVPTALMNLVGIDQEPSLERRKRAASLPLLFTKPSNLEQERVARRLEANGCVLVQGPPGTGKTHTIANLIGHLLAQGKTILVTSHTSKALAVVREQVVPQLRSLCVSVLDDGRQGQKLLEMAVNAIADALTQKTEDELEVESQNLAGQRQRLEQSLAQTQSRLLEALRSEFEDLVVGGDAILPLEAAQKLRSWSGSHDWLPGEVAESQLCPLSADEVDELYHLQVLFPWEDEKLLQGDLPDSAALIEPGQFAGLVEAERTLAEEGTSFGADHWIRECGDRDALRTLAETARSLVRQIPAERWQVEIVQAGTQGSEAALWRQLVESIRDVESACTRHRALIYQHNPQIEGLDWPPRRQIEICKELLEHARAGKKVGFLNRLLKGEWVAFRNASSVSGAPPERPEDYEGLLAFLELRSAREQLRSRWTLQAVPHGAPELSESMPEREATLFADTIEVCLDWEGQSWRPFTERAHCLGLDWQKIWHLTLTTADSLTRRRQGIEEYLIPTVEAKLRALELGALRSRLKETFLALASSSSPLSAQLKEAAEQRQEVAYRQLWLRLRELEEQRQRASRREALLARLREKASGWARAIGERAPDHQGPEPPGPIEEAWLYAQWSQQLKRRHQLDLDALQKRASETKEELRKLTAKYVEVLTWKFQAGRTGNAQRQALIGWLETIRKIGKGTGKYADTYRAAAREKLKECRTAVPVWIMPFSKVVESYRPGEVLFDVVIVDEASQADVTGLLAFTLGKEVIVVGDHEQVSPTAFEDGGRALALAKERLLGIPNCELYSGKRSVYDMARASFGETIRLREHFRCVPEIIQFSNELCYDGDIQALRESGHSIVPPVVSHRVMTGQRQGRAKTNDEEAREIVSLIAACIEHPEYDGKSMGVISMVGDDQALLIQKYLHEFVPPSVYEERRLLCGNAAQFQGDERNVMFLSFVNSPVGTGPLRMIESRQEDIQRYNVAASRAKDQMWLCHSFQPSSDLKPNDLRARLLSHAGRCAADSVIAEQLPKTESPFEAQVLTRLVRSGYRVVPQLPVGSYRVDMVVLGRSRRIAIECDGEAYHGPDKLEADLARQQILERVAGLTFVRIRGSAYFRDPDEAMRVVLRRLEELGVEKLGAAPPEEGPEDHPLRDSVVKRAQELRAEWWPSGRTAIGQNDNWVALERRLEDWPLLELTRLDTDESIFSVSISHDKEEVVLVAADSANLDEYLQGLDDSFTRFVVVELSEPEEALRQALEALGLQTQQDSRELPAHQGTPASVEGVTLNALPIASNVERPEQNLSLHQAVTSALMEVVKADGVILETEVQTVLELLETRFRFGAETLPEIRSWLDVYREQSAPPGSIARTLRSIPREQRELVVQSAVELAWCDGHLHPQEQSAIRALGVELDLDRMTVEALLAQSRTQEAFDPFKILGLQPHADPEVVRATVNRLREQFQAENFLHIGAEFVELASTRRAEIERAWEMLKGSFPEPQTTEPVRDELPTSIDDGEQPATQVENTYREFEGAAGPDPRTASLDEIAAGLKAIVEVEGPVATSRLYEVYLRGCGVKRLGHELRKSLNKALARTLSEKALVIVENSPKGGYKFAVAACSEGPFVRVRPRGPRTLEEIPKAELQAVARICESSWPAGSEEHYRGILEYYDLKKLTTNTKALLDSVLQGEVEMSPCGSGPN